MAVKPTTKYTCPQSNQTAAAGAVSRDGFDFGECWIE